jgi:ribosome-associated translation inhibitor RaiA
MAQKYDSYVPIFRLKPQKRKSDESTCIISHVGYIDQSKETLLDEVIEIKTTDYEIKRFGKNVDYIKTLYNYDITAIIMRNNIKGDILLKGEYFPVYSVSIGFTKNTVTGFLFDIFVGFVPNQESLQLLKNPKEIVNAKLTGSYTLKVYFDQQVTEKYNSFVDSLDEKIVEDSQIADKISNMNEDDAMKYIEEKIDEVKEFYKDLQNGYVMFEYENHDDVLEKLRDLYRSHKIDYLIDFTLIESEKKRAKKYNAIESYEIPKNVIKLNQIKDNINNLSTLLDKQL